MAFVYLDQNIVDSLDKDGGNEIVAFLEGNRFIPVVSTSSLVEIERGGRPDRIRVNIQSLTDIGTRFILENESGMTIERLSEDQILELMSRKNRLAGEVIGLLNKAQFFKLCSTSKCELEERMNEIIEEIRILIGNLDESQKKLQGNLLTCIDMYNKLIKDGVPQNFHFLNDVRSMLMVNPKEMNNLSPNELWKKIDEMLLRIKPYQFFNFTEGTVREKLYNILLMLNIIGYWSDKINGEDKQLTFNYDCIHGLYGCYCFGIVSEDRRFLKRLEAAYHYLAIQTKVFHLSKNVIAGLK